MAPPRSCFGSLSCLLQSRMELRRRVILGIFYRICLRLLVAESSSRRQHVLRAFENVLNPVKHKIQTLLCRNFPGSKAIHCLQWDVICWNSKQFIRRIHRHWVSSRMSPSTPEMSFIHYIPGSCGWSKRKLCVWEKSPTRLSRPGRNMIGWVFFNCLFYCDTHYY